MLVQGALLQTSGPWHSFYDDDGVAVRPSCVGVAKVVVYLVQLHSHGAIVVSISATACPLYCGESGKDVHELCVKLSEAKKSFSGDPANHSHAATRHSGVLEDVHMLSNPKSTRLACRMFATWILLCWILLFPMFICTYA